MKHSKIAAVAVLGAGIVAFAGCDQMHREHNEKRMKSTASADSMNSGAMNGESMKSSAMKTASATLKPSQAATTQPANNNVRGTLTFTQMGNDVKVTGEIVGLSPNTEHGLHVHEKGDLSAADFSSAGPHFDPSSTMHHGGPDEANAHGGDMGNVMSDGAGSVKVSMMLKNVTLTQGPKRILGRSIIVHAKRDDLKSQPAGDSGARVAGGVIESR